MCDVSRAAEGIRLLPWPVSAAYSGSLRIKHSGPYTIIFTACKLLSVVRQKRLFTCSVCDRYSKAGLTMPGLFLVSFSVFLGLFQDSTDSAASLLIKGSVSLPALPFVSDITSEKEMVYAKFKYFWDQTDKSNQKQ